MKVWDTIILILKDLSSIDICSLTSSCSKLREIRRNEYIVKELLKYKFKFITRVDSEEYECIDLYKIYFGINHDTMIKYSDKLKVIFDCGYKEIVYQILTRRAICPPFENLKYILIQSMVLNASDIFLRYIRNNRDNI